MLTNLYIFIPLWIIYFVPIDVKGQALPIYHPHFLLLSYYALKISSSPLSRYHFLVHIFVFLIKLMELLIPLFVCRRIFKFSLIPFKDSFIFFLSSLYSLQLRSKCSAVSLFPHRHLSLVLCSILCIYDLK